MRIGDERYAIGDECSHADFSLAEGEVWADECEIECPKHGSTFSLATGEPQTLPATQPVAVYPVRVDGDDVVVTVQEQGRCDPHQRLYQVLLIFKPATVLRWHRELARRKWTFSRKAKPGQPTISSELETSILRLAKENSRREFDKIQGELLKLGHRLSAISVRNILKRYRITPAFERSSGSWHSISGHYREQRMACDVFTLEAIWLKAIYVLFFIELGTRRIHLGGCTTSTQGKSVG